MLKVSGRQFTFTMHWKTFDKYTSEQKNEEGDQKTRPDNTEREIVKVFEMT